MVQMCEKVGFEYGWKLYLKKYHANFQFFVRVRLREEKMKILNSFAAYVSAKSVSDSMAYHDKKLSDAEQGHSQRYNQFMK